MTSIGEGVFSNWSALKSVTIGNGVTSIGYGVFSGCSNLEIITVLGRTTSAAQELLAHLDIDPEYCTIVGELG